MKGEYVGPNLYAFVGNDGVNGGDRLGMASLGAAKKRLREEGAKPLGRSRTPVISAGSSFGGVILPNQCRDVFFYTDPQIFEAWLELEEENRGWWTVVKQAAVLRSVCNLHD